MHVVWVAVSDPLVIDVPATLRVLDVVARLPYQGAMPQAASDWLYRDYGETGFTPEETAIGPGHFLLRVSGDNIADLELRAPDY